VCPDTQSYDFKLSLIQQGDLQVDNIKIYNPKLGSFVTDKELPFLVSIPVDVTSDNTSVLFDFTLKDSSVVTDTIIFKYNKTTCMEHPQCGFVMKFEITDSLATHNHIDSVSWKNNLLDEDNELNLEIYYQ
jgi:hypothetical protein